MCKPDQEAITDDCFHLYILFFKHGVWPINLNNKAMENLQCTQLKYCIYL